MILYIIRHGETDWNKEVRLQGRIDIPLNETGRRIAELTSEGLKDVVFDVAFTSPLQRARETAQIILRDRKIELIDEEKLIEMAFGEYEGYCYSKENYNIPAAEFVNFFMKPEDYQPPEGAESFQDVDARAKAFWKKMIENQRYKDSTVLVSTHGAMLRGLLRIIKQTPLERYWEDGLHKNCAFSVVELKDGEMKILQEAVTLYNEEAR